MMDDQAILRQMDNNYSDGEIKFLIKWLILKIQAEIELLLDPNEEGYE